MKASTERKIIRWLHIVLSIPIIGFIYGPVASFTRPALFVKWLAFPLLVLSGLWLWKGQVLKKKLKRRLGNEK